MSLSKKRLATNKKGSSSISQDGSTLGKSRFSTIGAPAQVSQSSRKGKRAWRKNVDIAELEEGLEELREEERITGGLVHKMTNEDLFTVDLRGDEKIRERFKTKRPLTATLILAQRSAVPAVHSRTVHGRKKEVVTKAEKERLLRIGKRKRTGSSNPAMGPTEIGNGSALLEPSEAVKQSGSYDVWMDVDEEEHISADDFDSIVQTKPVKPRTLPLRNLISAPAIASPHQGASYNPPIEAYKELVQNAVKIEEKKEAESRKYDAIRATMESARRTIHGYDVPVAEGMIIDVTGDDVEEGADAQQESTVPNKVTRRKTQQQRRKALSILEEERALKDKAARKKMLATVDTIKSLRRGVENAKNEQERVAAQRKLEKMEQLRKGLAGQRFGKHKVVKGEIDVQLGEDLSDSLRGLKVEGNLFRDRFVSMQKRALVEPRTRVFPTRRKIKVKELEKFAWKRFT